MAICFCAKVLELVEEFWWCTQTDYVEDTVLYVYMFFCIFLVQPFNEKQVQSWLTVPLSLYCTILITTLVLPNKTWKSHRYSGCFVLFELISMWHTDRCVGMTGWWCIQHQCKHLWFWRGRQGNYRQTLVWWGVLPYMVKLVAVDVFSHQKCAVHSMVLYWVSCVWDPWSHFTLVHSTF